MQKLDTTKSFGTIYGHPDAAYVQNEKMFDLQGNEVGAVEEEEALSEPEFVGEENSEKEGHPVEKWLTECLHDTVKSQAAVKRESEDAKILWDDVLTAAANMDVEKFKKGVVLNWKLKS